MGSFYESTNMNLDPTDYMSIIGQGEKNKTDLL